MNRFAAAFVTTCVVIGGLFAGFPATAQQPTTPAVPRLVRFGGSIVRADGTPRSGVVGVMFSIYEQEQGGSALWTELQNVELDTSGRYSVLLGSQHAAGVPAELFTAHGERWLGIQVEAEPEQARVLLASVPYALKAADADTLGGFTLQQILAGISPAPRAAAFNTFSTPDVALTLGRPGRVSAAASAASSTGPKLQLRMDSTPSGVVEAYNDATSTPLFLLLNPLGGNVGIGTASPSSPLTVAGLIQSTAGGFKFPDASTQTTAGIPLVSGCANGNVLGWNGSAWVCAAANGGVATIIAGTGITTAGTTNVTVGVDATKVALLASANTFTANQAITGNLALTGTVSGNGSGLTSLNASNLATGTVPVAALTGTYNVNISGNAATATAAGTATNLSGALAGDVTGTQGATSVVKLRGNALASVAPADGQVLSFNGASGQWQPTSLLGGALPYLSRNTADASSASIAATGGQLYSFTQSNTTAATADRAVLKLTDSTTTPGANDYLLIGQTPGTFSVSSTGAVKATSFAGSGNITTSGNVGGASLCVAADCRTAWPAGTVTSIAAGAGLTASGGPITNSGTLSFDTTFGDGRYAQLGADNSLTGALSVNTGAATAFTATSTFLGGVGLSAAGKYRGGQFGSDGATGTGVLGNASSPTGVTFGGYFVSSSTAGKGVRGMASSTTGSTVGVEGWSYSPDGYAGYFRNMNSAGKSLATFDNLGVETFTVLSNGNIGIGTPTPGDGAKLNVVGGSIAIGATPQTANAALHISSSFGGFDRLTQISASGTSKPALNLMASTNGAGTQQFWSWGVDTDNKWKIQPTYDFTGGGLSIDAAGNTAASANLTAGLDVTAGGNVTATGNVVGAGVCIAGDCRTAWPSSNPGTVTSVAAGSGLTASPSPITGAGTLSFDTSFGDSRYAQLNATNTFSKTQSVITPNSTAISGQSSYANGTGIAGTGPAYGGYFTAAGGTGVFGDSQTASGFTGVWGQTEGPSGRGVVGLSTSTTGSTLGGLFQSNSTSGKGLFAIASAASGFTIGGDFDNESSSGIAVQGFAYASTGNTVGVSGTSNSAGGYGGLFRNLKSGGTSLAAQDNNGNEIFSVKTSGSVGIGTTTPVSGAKLNVVGAVSIGAVAPTADAALHVNSSYGGFGRLSQMSVTGTSLPALNLMASTDSNSAQQFWAWGVDSDNKFKLQSGFGFSPSGGLTVDGSGNTHVAGTLTVVGSISKGSGSFKIDHPLDPENKYLYHSFVESPDMMNVYNGNIVLDRKGEAWVELPDWFEALNRDFRYQLTAIGAPGPNLYVAKKVEQNRFKIAGGRPGSEVSWQVTGIRHDAYAEKHRIPVEEDKPAAERGAYLYPDAYGLSPRSSPVTQVRH